MIELKVVRVGNSLGVRLPREALNRLQLEAAYVFLACNGLSLNATEASATQAVLDLAAGKIAEDSFAQWLRDHVVRGR